MPNSLFVIFLTTNPLLTNHLGDSISQSGPGSLTPYEYQGNIQTPGL